MWFLYSMKDQSENDLVFRYSGQPMLDMDSLAKLRSFIELVSNSRSSSSSSIFFIRILYLKVSIPNENVSKLNLQPTLNTQREIR